MSEYRLHHGDCLEVMATLPECSVDTIITDPPYGLSFMGKDWDHGVPGVRFWREALRVAKPGAFLLAFGGTRTFHRLAVAIEDAGWEIRDTIFWAFGQGFPKSHSIQKALHKAACGCKITARPEPYTHEEAEPTTQHKLYSLRNTDVPTPVADENRDGKFLQPVVSQQGSPPNAQARAKPKTSGQEQPRLEGRGNILQNARQLHGGEIHPRPGMGDSDGAQRRLHNGTPPNNGADGRTAANSQRSCASPESRPVRQQAQQSGTVAHERQSQKSRVGQNCDRCGKPYIPDEIIEQWDGYGTALKPAFEPVIVAMKPIPTTFADNALTHGVAGLWIDGGRIPANGDVMRRANNVTIGGNGIYQGGVACVTGAADGRRWPANLIHDGSDEATAGMGDAARYFYCAKASRSERNAGLEGLEERDSDQSYGSIRTNRGNGYEKANRLQNHHPTVKPLALMQYLCRLTRTPTGGVVLDPFMGSGSTGCAAMLEGRDFIGIDLNAEYIEIARRRIEHWRPDVVQPSLLEALQ